MDLQELLKNNKCFVPDIQEEVSINSSPFTFKIIPSSEVFDWDIVFIVPSIDILENILIDLGGNFEITNTDFYLVEENKEYILEVFGMYGIECIARGILFKEENIKRHFELKSNCHLLWHPLYCGSPSKDSPFHGMKINKIEIIK